MRDLISNMQPIVSIESSIAIYHARAINSASNLFIATIFLESLLILASLFLMFPPAYLIYHSISLAISLLK